MAIAALLLLVVALLIVIETGWAKNQLRAFIVRQANQYLTATLSIDELGGSLLRGIHLGGIRVARDGKTLISIDAVDVSYSIRELYQQGTTLRRVSVTRPVVVANRQEDGRWDLAALVRRNAQEDGRRGPGRPLHLLDIEVTDARVDILSPIRFGIADLPAEFASLNARFSYNYEPVRWVLDFDHASWIGRAPNLTVNAFSGVIRSSGDALELEQLHVVSPRSDVLVNGQQDRRVDPGILDLDVKATRFAFQEWGGVVATINNIAVEGPFTAHLHGPVKQLETALDLSSTGGGVKGVFTIDTVEPGWRGAGKVTLTRLDLAKWLNRADDASDITGDVNFDINMPPGSHFPRGTYAFDGSHARFMDYEADDVVARGDITPTAVRIAAGTATAYGANVRLDGGSIGIDAPFPFAFKGLVNGIDLRRLPKNVPVPHVESTLFFTYDVTGRFRQGFVRGTAAFQDSEFLGTHLGAGATGFVDTSVQPFLYSGEGDLSDIDLPRMGAGLDIAWMQDPRYVGRIAGHFKVEGTGGPAADMRMTGGGRLTRATLFDGVLRDADVSIDIADGSLVGSYDGQLERVRPALAMNDARYESVLTGHGRGRVAVRDMMRRSPELPDYTIDATLSLISGTEVRGVPLTAGETTARLADSILSFERLDVSGPSLAGSAGGTLALDDVRSSQLSYDVRRAHLDDFQEMLGRPIRGDLTTNGVLTGPLDTIHAVGEGTLSNLDVASLKALSATAKYDATIPTASPSDSVVTLDGTLTFVETAGQQFKEVIGTVTYRTGRANVDLRLTRENGLQGRIVALASVDLDARTATFDSASVEIDRSAWSLQPMVPPMQIGWDERGLRVDRLVLVDSGGVGQRLTADGTWYPEGGGALKVTARQVSLDALSPRDTVGGPARYGGTLDADLVVSGSRAAPILNGTITIVDGRVWRTSYERLAGRIEYRGSAFAVDLRLDQAPGIWLTVAGTLPADVVTLGRESAGALNLEIHSSRVGLGLIEGLTNVVRNVGGALEVNVGVVGTMKDPHFTGRVDITGAEFIVAASGARYRNGRVALQMASDKIAVETLHLEDRDGDPLDVTGALGTHELRVNDLQMVVRGRDFEVLRNEFGQMDIDADLTFGGQFERPHLDGRVTVKRGQLQVDSILDRTLFRPYSTAAAPSPSIPAPDAIVALNPWERLSIGMELHVPGTLRLVGDNIQVSPGTPIGLGDVNLRALGDLYFTKGAGSPLFVTGSLDSVTGTYAFQGRRFDLDPGSSINFRGDFNPDIYVTVEREISGVTTRVTIAGLLSEPALRLSSTPPLDQSDILSLIVFNTTTNELNASQQQQLAGRAATIAAGFLAAPILTAIEQSLGLDTLEIVTDASAVGGGTRVTIGEEIAPGLVARFSRQFGTDQYDEAQIEYFLSRLFRLRATFSDASSLSTRSPFRRVERAGIDFLIFFSF